MPYSRAVVLVALVAALAAAVFVVREQRDANRRILNTLGEVKTALGDQTRRAGELEQQVSALAERVLSLEREVVDLRRRVVRLSRRPAELATLTPAPIETMTLAPSAELAPTITSEPLETALLETVPISWATDWRSYQPAGIIAPTPAIVLERKLADPAFLKKMYVTYAALQAGDVITTTAALNRGAQEGNPLVRGIAGSPAAMIGAKVAAGVVTIVVIEKVRETRPVLATISLIAINATLAAVVINNAAVAAGAPRP